MEPPNSNRTLKPNRALKPSTLKPSNGIGISIPFIVNLLSALQNYRSPAGQPETRHFTRFRPIPAKPRDRHTVRPITQTDAATQPPHLIVLSIPPRTRFVKLFLPFNSQVFAYLLFDCLNGKRIVFAFAFAGTVVLAVEVEVTVVFAFAVTVAIADAFSFAFSRCNVVPDRTGAR